MSAPDARHAAAAGVRLASVPADIVELVALRSRSVDLGRLAAARGLALADFGHIAAQSPGLTLSVRPRRWLLLTPAASGGSGATAWEEATAGCGAAIDLSCALTALVISGPAVRDMLARSCRLDLAAAAFPDGRAAATIMVQVPVILAALGGAMLLLTPATTARHVYEWLVTTSQPFGLALAPQVSPADLSGDHRV